MRDYSLLIIGSSNVDEDDSGGRSPSRQGAETGTSVPKLGFWMAAELGIKFGKILQGREF